MNRIATAAVLLLILLVPATARARGGGGCLEEGTAILTPSGPIAIERLAPGDEVLSASGPGLRRATVRAVVRVDADEYLELAFAGGVLRVTPEHPVACGPGVFRSASGLRPGDSLLAWSGTAIHETALLAVRRAPARRPAYNLLVHPAGTFVANGLAVHNKGCFLPDTPVLRADGTPVAIRDVRPGDALLAFTTAGAVVSAAVLRVIELEADEYAEVATDRAVLRVTPEHPFYAGNGTFRTLESLRPGDTVYAWDGRGLAAQRLLRIDRIRGRVRVYNLQTGAPNTFFAGGIAVHNKGGGCFPAGTRIATPDGDRPIESLRAGDPVLGADDDGRPVPSRVEAVLATRSALLALETEAGTLRVTAGHPFRTGPGEFREAGTLSAGVRLWRIRDGQGGPVRVSGIREEAGEQTVFNLRVAAPHTFIADGFVVHNKGGGCFPAGTRIRTPSGDAAIETLSAGDRVLAVTDDGRSVAASVREIVSTQSPLLIVESETGRLRTTASHPVRLSGGGYREAGDLDGDDVLASWQAGAIRPSRVRQRIEDRDLTRVYNLSVDGPHTFIADGFVVHNKGGGFRSSGSRSGGSGRPMSPEEQKVFLAVMGGVILVVIVAVVATRKRNREVEDLDYRFPASAIDAKAAKTRKLLEFIARTDAAWAPDLLQQAARETFLKLQACWQAREYEPMRPLLMPDLHAQHLRQINGMIRNHEINVMGDLAVERIDIVHVRYTDREERREFTALVSARARDHYVDDRTGREIRGDAQAARFQEFWVFQRLGGVWRLREIEQTRESDALKDENVFELFTDEKLQAIYAEAASPGGPAGPWLETASETKEDRIARLLAFLVQTDPLWDRRTMRDRARAVFLEVHLAREAGDPAGVPAASLFPDAAASLADEMRRRRETRTSVEYRNLCVRKVELVHVRNVADRSQDAFTARIRAHAQVVVLRDGATVRRDADVKPFEAYWTFGRFENAWRLREVQPAARGQAMVGEENVDEDSSAEQLQWYYTKSRAV